MTHTAAQYVVIGNPVAHSRSPFIHARFARQTGLAVSYETRLAPLDGFADNVRAFILEGGRGANVTVPFKLDAFALAHEHTARALAAGAVNTLSFSDGRIAADNTDGAGLVADIEGNAGIRLAGKRVLLLGAGGAARGALLPLLDAAPRSLTIANRTAANAEALARQFAGQAAGRLQACALTALEGCFDVIVNATSASLNGEVPPLAPALFSSNTLALDMMYGAEPTAFMRLARLHGAAARDGCGMLVEQAAEAFFVWHGVRPATGAVLDELRAALGQAPASSS
jgi:shikimate dehydrogenase